MAAVCLYLLAACVASGLAVEVPKLPLSSGGSIPVVGLGTWQVSDAKKIKTAVDAALEAGYRHIDTAAVYGNERMIGDEIQGGWANSKKGTRDDLFLVTKLPPTGMRAEVVGAFLNHSLTELRTDYVDLYLIHSPIGVQSAGGAGPYKSPVNKDGTAPFQQNTDHVAVWKAMEEQVDAGRAKAIGLSNFNQRQIQRILDHCRIKPANLQVELHVYMQQRPLVEFCKKHGITVTAYSPLGSNGLGAAKGLPNMMADPVVVDIAKKHNVSPSQVLLKHIVQRGIVVIPKSTNKEHIKENIQLFDFELSPEETAKLDALDKGKNGRILDMKFIKGSDMHPEYPFHEYP